MLKIKCALEIYISTFYVSFLFTREIRSASTKLIFTTSLRDVRFHFFFYKLLFTIITPSFSWHIFWLKKALSSFYKVSFCGQKANQQIQCVFNAPFSCKFLWYLSILVEVRNFCICILLQYPFMSFKCSSLTYHFLTLN